MYMYSRGTEQRYGTEVWNGSPKQVWSWCVELVWSRTLFRTLQLDLRPYVCGLVWYPAVWMFDVRVAVLYLSLRSSSDHLTYFSSTSIASVFPSFRSHCFNMVHLGREKSTLVGGSGLHPIFFGPPIVLQHCGWLNMKLFQKELFSFYTPSLSVSLHNWYLASSAGFTVLWIARPIAAYCRFRSDDSMSDGDAIELNSSFCCWLSFITLRPAGVTVSWARNNH